MNRRSCIQYPANIFNFPAYNDYFELPTLRAAEDQTTCHHEAGQTYPNNLDQYAFCCKWQKRIYQPLAVPK